MYRYFLSSRQSTKELTFMTLKIFFVTNLIYFYVLLHNDNYRRRWLGNGQTKNIVFVFDATNLCPSRKMMEKCWMDHFNHLLIIIEFCVSKILYQKSRYNATQKRENIIYKAFILVLWHSMRALKNIIDSLSNVPSTLRKYSNWVA